MRIASGFWIACGGFALALAACGGTDGDVLRVRSGDAELRARVEPETPRVGENALLLELVDADGKPLAGAVVRVRVHMHAMGAMPAMGGPAAVREEGPGRYRADFDLGMGGTWQVEIEIEPPGARTLRAEGSLTTGRPGLHLAAVGGDAGDAAKVAEAAPEHAAHGEAEHPGEFQMDPGRLQQVGVRLAKVERKQLETRVRAAGLVAAEEATLSDVALRVKGWIGEIDVDAVGNPVQRGQILFRVYSPELYGAQEELLQALRSQQRAQDAGGEGRSDYLVRAARNRLKLFGLAPADLAAIEQRGEPQEHLPIRSPVAGYVIEKNVSQGSAFEPGQRLYRIAPLSRVWVEAEVYELEMAAVAPGQRAQIELPSLPGRSFEAKVAYVFPTLDPATRTVRVRLELPNPALELRPGMQANVQLFVDRGERLLVPQSALLEAGTRTFVFRSLGDGRFRPQQVETGMRSGEEVELLSGLEAGDEIVASGTFLIASESRLRAALERW
ncbi:MAG TPA: efflux RND transporter periplasmic adaptor subunit [Myxococcota bacterium]|nr:efflux RND transporter periplasmic adaptor subunit [Myxococcota bacterium]